MAMLIIGNQSYDSLVRETLLYAGCTLTAEHQETAMLYLITENGERRFMNRADYEKWEAGIFTNKEPLTIPWQKITAANIDALVK